MNEWINSLNSTKVKKWFKNFFFNSNILFVIFVFRFEEIFPKAFLSKIRHQIWGILCFIHLSKFTLIIVKWLRKKQQFSTLAYSDKYLFYLRGFFTEDEMTGWHHWLDGPESQWTLGVGDGQGGLACCDSWGRKESATTERLIWSDLSCVLPSTFVYFKQKTFCFKRMHVVKCQKEYTLKSIPSSLSISQMLASHFSRELPLTGFSDLRLEYLAFDPCLLWEKEWNVHKATRFLGFDKFGNLHTGNWILRLVVK